MIKINAKTVEFERYPNGETKINTDIEYSTSSEVVLYFESNEDLIHLMFLQNLYQFETLVIRYMPYSRQDRAVGGGAFTLKWVSQFINSLGFNNIYIDDPHSDVTMALIDNSMVGESSLDLLNEVIEETNFDIKNDYLFFPDAGAQKKYISEISFKYLVGFKQRDNLTGKITNLEILGKRETGDKIIIVDDICSYGGTFILAAKALRQMFDKVYLCVYHLEPSVYKGELLAGGLIDGIWCSDSLMRESNHELIHIIGDQMNKLSEAYRLESDHMPIEEGLSCCICGDEFEIGQIAVGVSAGLENPRLIQEAHLGCAINDDEIEFDGIPSIIQNLKTVK